MVVVSPQAGRISLLRIDPDFRTCTPGSGVPCNGRRTFRLGPRFGESGEVFVVPAGPELEPYIVNDVGETCLATPAVSAGRIYFRTRHHVLALAIETD